MLQLKKGESVLVIGQGPIGIILALLAQRAGGRVITSDLYPQRLTIAKGYGVDSTLDAGRENVVEAVRGSTDGRGVGLSATPGTLGASQAGPSRSLSWARP